MSKKKWILVIFVIAVVGYLIFSKVAPGMAQGIDDFVGPQVSDTINMITTTITTSTIWISWGYYISFAIGGIITFILVWQGHKKYDKVEHFFAKKAAQHSPMVTTQRSDVRTTTPSYATTRPTETATPPQTPVEPPAQPPEETKEVGS